MIYQDTDVISSPGQELDILLYTVSSFWFFQNGFSIKWNCKKWCYEGIKKKTITEKFFYFVFPKFNILPHNIACFLESNLK